MSVVGKSKVDLVYSLVHNQQQRDMLARRLVDVVRKSFDEDLPAHGLIIMPHRSPSRDEIVERTNIVFDWFLRLRGDLHYSLPKALDMLPVALRAHLRGENWTPPPADRAWGLEKTDAQYPPKVA